MEDALFVTIGMVAVASVAWVISKRWSLWRRGRSASIRAEPGGMTTESS